MTMAEVLETMDEEQRNALYYVVGCYVEDGTNPREATVYRRLIATLNDVQRKMVECVIDEVLKNESVRG